MLIVGCFLAAGLTIGALAANHPLFAAAVVLAAALGLLIAVNRSALPAFLVFTMFVESLAIAPGLRIGRIAAVLALAVVLYSLLTGGRAGLKPNLLLGVVAAYGVWAVASAYWANDTHAVYGYIGRYGLAVSYMVAFALLVRTERQLTTVFITLGVGALVFGIAAFFGYDPSAEKYSVQQAAKGLQGDHNFFALYQVVALPAALTIAALERRPHRILAYYGIVGAILLSVVASLSRSGLLALAVVVVATLLLPWRYFFRRASQKAAYAFALLGAAGLVALAGAAPFVSRALTIFREKETGRGAGRIDLWRAAWHAFRQHEVVGIGAGNFRGRSFELLQATPGVTTTAGFDPRGKYVHNMFLGNLTELGLVGFALFVILIALTAWYLWRSFKRVREAGNSTTARFCIALLVSLIGLCTSGFFLSIELAKALWIIVGLAIALDVITRQPSPPGRRTADASPGSPPHTPRSRDSRF
jgi:O-antigen ligase